MELPQILTKDQCAKVLERYTQSKNFQIKSYSINPFQNQLDGLICEQNFLKIHYQIDGKDYSVQFFLKVLNESNRAMFNISRAMCAFEKEAFYYDTLIPLLKSKGLSGDYVPKSYFIEPFVVVLEDLSQRSFKGILKDKPLDVEGCKKCLETLAKFHAEPIIYELEKSKELGKKYTLRDEFGDILEDKVFCKGENGSTKFMKASLKALFPVIDVIPENGVTKTEFQASLQAAFDRMLASEEDTMGFRSTLLHADVWTNNFLYRYEDEDCSKISECVVIDFQLLKYGPPASDVVQFLHTNTRKNFRDQHQNELLKYYYQSFTSVFKDRGIEADEVLSESEFLKSCQAYALPAKIASILDRSSTFLVDEEYLEAYHDEEKFLKYLYDDRERIIVNGFNKNEEYKELLTEDIIELRDLIFGKH